MVPKFLYFDLGRVLADFDPWRLAQQVGEVAGIGPEQALDAIYRGNLQADFELGRISRHEFFETFCRQTGTHPDPAAFRHAASDMFTLRSSMLPVVAHLQRAGYRLGILSNTCCDHWEHCVGRFRILAEAFEVVALSYEIHAAKPDPAIYQAAARLAGVSPGEIFFTDDLPENVAGACAAGFDAVVYTTTARLAADLRDRGLRFNY